MASTFKSQAAHEQSAVFSRQSAGFRLHERKNMAFQAMQIELPRLSSRGPLMNSRQSSVGSRQSVLSTPGLRSTQGKQIAHGNLEGVKGQYAVLYWQ